MNRTLLEITPAGTMVSGALAGGRLIRHVRERSAISQAELARRIGTSRQVVNRWENGVREPSFSSVMSAVGACGWDLIAALTLRDEIDKELREPEHLRAVGPTHPASLTILGLDIGHGGERRIQAIRSLRRWRALRRATSAQHDRRPVPRQSASAARLPQTKNLPSRCSSAPSTIIDPP